LTKGVIATPHRLAGEAGAQVLRDGGNAIDAAIAADAVLCVVYPHMTSVCGRFGPGRADRSGALG
jgi:gamma-glutamyltranspeptidase